MVDDIYVVMSAVSSLSTSSASLHFTFLVFSLLHRRRFVDRVGMWVLCRRCRVTSTSSTFAVSISFAVFNIFFITVVDWLSLSPSKSRRQYPLSDDAVYSSPSSTSLFSASSLSSTQSRRLFFIASPARLLQIADFRLVQRVY